MHRHIFAKLKSKVGESLGETLVALLISAMSMLIMAGAIVSTAKANDAANRVNPFAANSEDEHTSSADQTLSVSFGGSSSDISVKVIKYNEEDSVKKIRSVYYYEAE